MNKTTIGTIEKGVLRYTPSSFGDVKDQEVLIEIRNIPKKRSTRQNAYLRGPILEGGVEAIRYLFGEILDKDQVLHIFKMKFLFIKVEDITTGEMEKIPRSTAELNNEEFTRFIDQIRTWLYHWGGITIQNPEDYFISKTDKNTLHIN